jgi:DNA-binding SARP family transcriptional activator
MESSYSPEQDVTILEPDAFSSVSYVEQGLNCIEQKHYLEGVAFFRLARERLCSDQMQLAATLEALIKTIMSYLNAQQALHEASKNFTEFDTQQQAQIEALQKILPTKVENTLPASSNGTQLRKNSGENQPLRLLQLPTSVTEHQISPPEDQNTLPPLFITCFGRFEVRCSDPSSSPISLCNNLKGQTILRYLVAQPKHRETVDKLMAALWPEDAPEVAERKLRIAISALRCSLNRDIVREPGGGYILCKGQAYQLNPSLQLHIDVDELLALYQAGQKACDNEKRISYYEQACQMYSGPFLTEDVYAEWSYFRREELMKTYVIMCDTLAEYYLQSQSYEAAAQWATAILKVDRCDEEAHRQLIRAYAAQGRRSEAMRQYQKCERVLGEELGVQPMPETQKLLQMLLN